MSTITAPAPMARIQTDHAPVTPGSYGCDRSECPAPATHRVEIHAQDFYFCGHHWREIVRPLLNLGAVDPGLPR